MDSLFRLPTTDSSLLTSHWLLVTGHWSPLTPRAAGQGRVSAERILKSVSKVFGVSDEEVRHRRLNDRIKPVAAVLLTTEGGLTQREAAAHWGLRTGVAVCLQLKRARAMGPGIQDVLRLIRQELTI